MTKIMVCDDHPILRKGIANFIDEINDCTVIAEAGRGEDVIRHLADGIIPDILLLDINMPLGMNGYEVAKTLHKYYPEIKIICLSQLSQKTVIAYMLNLGVHGFLSKETLSASLLSAITDVSAGKWFIDSPTVKFSGFEFPDFIMYKTGIEKLTSREIEVARLMSGEKSYKEIADILEISLYTLENIKTRIFQKTETNSRIEVTGFMMRCGLVQ